MNRTKGSWKEALKKSFIEAGLLYAASQDSYNGNGRAAAEAMRAYREMTA